MVAELRKRVVVIASGVTEQLALPHLLSHLRDEGICVSAVRIPKGHRDLRVKIAEDLINSEWAVSQTPPDKFVILVDVDRKDPDGKLAHFKEGLPGRLPSESGHCFSTHTLGSISRRGTLQTRRTSGSISAAKTWGASMPPIRTRSRTRNCT